MATETVRRFAVILHADVAGSTRLVQQNESLAHKRITEAFERLSDCITTYGGTVHETRGDALLAEFSRASDAVPSALKFQRENADVNAALDDELRPTVRIGVTLGEVIVADGTVTGAGVVLAQRIEQLAEPGGLCVTEAVRESAPSRLPFSYEDLGQQSVKGFDDAVHAFSVRANPNEELPAPEPISAALLARSHGKRGLSRAGLAAVVALVVIAGGLTAWTRPWQQPALVSEQSSIAVLPFDNMTGDTNLDYFGDGMAENIITALAHTAAPWVRVMSRTSSFAYKGKPVTVQKIGKDLNVKFVLEGSVQKSKDTVRITAQLIDAESGDHEWAQNFDETSGDILALQDAVVGRISETLGRYNQGLLRKLSTRRAWAKDGLSLTEFDYMIRGHEHFEQFTPAGNAKALQIFEEGLARFPDSALMRAKVGWALFMDVFIYASSKNPEAETKRLFQLVREALADDKAPLVSDFMATYLYGFTYVKVGEIEKGVVQFQKAVELVPGSGRARLGLGNAQIQAGQVREGMANLELADLNEPNYPFYPAYISRGLRQLGEYEKAAAWLERFPVEVYYKYADLASVYVKLGKSEEAKAAVRKAIAIYPALSVAIMRREWPYLDNEFQEGYLADLLEAGLPAG